MQTAEESGSQPGHKDLSKFLELFDEGLQKLADEKNIDTTTLLKVVGSLQQHPERSRTGQSSQHLDRAANTLVTEMNGMDIEGPAGGYLPQSDQAIDHELQRSVAQNRRKVMRKQQKKDHQTKKDAQTGSVFAAPTADWSGAALLPDSPKDSIDDVDDVERVFVPSARKAQSWVSGSSIQTSRER